MKRIAKITLLCILTVIVLSPNARSAGMDHHLWDQLLQKHVKGGLVDYKKIKDNPQDLNQYLKLVAELPQDQLSALTGPQQIAFYLNAYNAITLKRIINHYPPKKSGVLDLLNPDISIKNISGVWNKIKDKVAGKLLTLDDIEHKILRKKFKEPRVHMALVCASLSCPPLADRAFSADNLPIQLDEVSREFLFDKTRNQLCSDCPQISLSKIFSWYGGDFEGVYNPDQRLIDRHGMKKASVITFAASYFPPATKDFLLKGDYDIEFMDYNWSLNDKK